jgi:hypothetical protein
VHIGGAPPVPVLVLVLVPVAVLVLALVPSPPAPPLPEPPAPPEPPVDVVDAEVDVASVVAGSSPPQPARSVVSIRIKPALFREIIRFYFPSSARAALLFLSAFT